MATCPSLLDTDVFECHGAASPGYFVCGGDVGLADVAQPRLAVVPVGLLVAQRVLGDEDLLHVGRALAVVEHVGIRRGTTTRGTRAPGRSRRRSAAPCPRTSWRSARRGTWRSRRCGWTAGRCPSPRPRGRPARGWPRWRWPSRRSSPGSSGTGRSAAAARCARWRSARPPRSRPAPGPAHLAATFSRPGCSARMMILEPSPSSPRRFSTGTTKSSRKTTLVRKAFDMPSRSIGWAVKPGYFFGSTMNAVTPLAPASRSVLAIRMPTSVSLAIEAHIFWPLMR